MKKIILLIFTIFSLQLHPVYAQLINVQSGTNIEELVNEYVGGAGVQIFNVESNTGQPEQFGSFTEGAPFFGFDEGVVLGTFNVELLAHPNQATDQYQSDEGIINIYDTDVVALLGEEGGHRNMAQIEFDFVPEGRILEFTFVFGSEEYNEYVNEAFNDQFAMILTGPGYNAVNIARLPTSGDVISINTVNLGQNSEYYINNEFTEGYNGNNMPLDGRTTAITARVEVQCNAQYHFKILILNRKDVIRGSAVFWKKGSLSASLEIPEMSLTTEPVCEGAEVTLTVDGNSNYNYVWSSGQSGVGLTSVTTTATIQSTEYSVQVFSDVYPECFSSRSGSIIVHPANNIAPSSTGINGTNGFTAYGQAGQELCFNVQTVDNPDELVTITDVIGIPSGLSEARNPTLPHWNSDFCWTPSVDDFGIYTFEMTYEDDNRCGELDHTDLITVHVLCPNCPVGIAYENRTPDNNPLPAETRMGEWISVGLSQPVAPGDAEVLFQAGNEIIYGPFWDSGPNFIGEIIPVCLDEEDCSSCCDDWTGFTYNPPGNPILTPNGDNCNDVWYLQDTEHPYYCSFNAMGFELEIRSPSGALVYSSEVMHEYCCPFTAPEGSPPPCPTEIPQQYSPINWPGICNNPAQPGYGCYVEDGTYFYTLELRSGCGQTQGLAGFMTVIGSLGDEDCGHQNLIAEAESTMELTAQREGLATQQMISDNINPRPALLLSYAPEYETAHVRINSEKQQEQVIRVEVFAMDGRLITVRNDCGINCSINLSSQAAGVYILKTVTNRGNAKSLKIMKK